METFALEVLDEATRRGVSYADVRAMRRQREAVATRDGAPERAGEANDHGFGVRVLVNGPGGIAATGKLTRTAIVATGAMAVEAARLARRPAPPL